MIRNILVVMPAADSHRRQLEAAAPGAVFTYASSPAEEDVARADAIVGNIRPELLAHAKNLKLLQLNSAGSNPYLSLPAVCPGARLCCATGAYGLAISEHMMGVLLELMNRDDRRLAEGLDALLRRGILEEHRDSRDPVYSFSHQRIRELIYARIPAEQRRSLHRQAAQLLEDEGAADSGACRRLARHFALAEQPIQCFRLTGEGETVQLLAL